MEEKQKKIRRLLTGNTHEKRRNAKSYLSHNKRKFMHTLTLTHVQMHGPMNKYTQIVISAKYKLSAFYGKTSR